MKNIGEAKLPPVGVMPKYIWEEKRFFQLREAILQYTSEFFPIPIEWVEEYNSLIKHRHG